jgi:hypothetical protein
MNSVHCLKTRNHQRRITFNYQQTTVNSKETVTNLIWIIFTKRTGRTGSKLHKFSNLADVNFVLDYNIFYL